MDLLTAAGRRGKGAERKENTGKENRKLCGIHNSSPETNAFVFSFVFER